MVVKQFKGRGRRATSTFDKPTGGWLFRLFMAWFARGRTHAIAADGESERPHGSRPGLSCDSRSGEA